MKKLLVCDLDGTLLDENNTIDKYSSSQVKKYLKSDNQICICTGRLDEDIKYIEQKFGFKSEFRISQNGCIIRDKNNKLVYEKTIDNLTVKEINKVIFDFGERIEVSDQNHRYFPSPRDPKLVAEFVDTSIVKDNLVDFIENKVVTPVIYLMFGNQSIFDEVKKELDRRIGSKINVTQTSPNSLEIFSAEASKGKALAWITKKQCVEKENLFVAGDAENDTTMFSLTDNTFAVGKLADKKAIDAANYKVDSVGDIIEKMM